MTKNILTIVLMVLALGEWADAQTLKGSRAAMLEQHRVALQHDFTLLETPAQVRGFVKSGYLVPLRGNQNYMVASVSFPYVRPEVRLWVERMASQYRPVCGSRMVVTSATRPKNQQPSNASPLSVHPTGMAVDLRIPSSSSCRGWLERTLLALDRAGVSQATRERRPPHYHIAVYPRQYVAYVEKRTGRPVRLAGVASPKPSPRSTPPARTAPPRPATATSSASVAHEVEVGESLWLIARRYGTSVEVLQRLNNLRGATVRPGQEIRLPVMVHRVAAGEVLGRIAERYGVSLAELQRSNDLGSPNAIREGTRLFIPGGVAEHIVVSGDTLSDIAEAYGSTTLRVREANKLASTTIKLGQRLIVPVGRK